MGTSIFYSSPPKAAYDDGKAAKALAHACSWSWSPTFFCKKSMICPSLRCSCAWTCRAVHGCLSVACCVLAPCSTLRCKFSITTLTTCQIQEISPHLIFKLCVQQAASQESRRAGHLPSGRQRQHGSQSHGFCQGVDLLLLTEPTKYQQPVNAHSQPSNHERLQHAQYWSIPNMEHGGVKYDLAAYILTAEISTVMSALLSLF